VWTTGGGGYGDPLKRDPAGVLNDVLDGKVSVDAARNSYGVVVVGRHVDEAATATERQHAAAVRGEIDWTYDRGELGHE
jgi:N-methylhydantoinase B